MAKPTTPSDPLRAFMRAVQTFAGGRHQPWRVFSDFCELATISLSQLPLKNEQREARYLEILKGYETEDATTFAQMMGMVVDGLEGEPCDFLGNAFQHLELSNHWHGQFFTPVPIAQMMAELSIDDALVREREFVTVCDPACGAGVMLLAFAQALLKRGINPQQRLHITAQDVDPTAARMAFVQLALSGLPATVIIGNTLALEQREVWHTPWHHLGFWDVKLRRVDTLKRVTPTPPTALPPPARAQLGQLSLGFAAA